MFFKGPKSGMVRASAADSTTKRGMHEAVRADTLLFWWLQISARCQTSLFSRSIVASNRFYVEYEAEKKPKGLIDADRCVIVFCGMFGRSCFVSWVPVRLFLCFALLVERVALVGRQKKNRKPSLPRTIQHTASHVSECVLAACFDLFIHESTQNSM